MISAPILGAPPQAKLNTVKPTDAIMNTGLNPIFSVSEDQSSGPRQYPPRKTNTATLDTSADTPKCALNSPKIADGHDEAKVEDRVKIPI